MFQFGGVGRRARILFLRGPELVEVAKDLVISRLMKLRGWLEAARRSPTLSAWPFVVVILTQMTVGEFSVYTLSATRTLVAGESLWSKGQHEAVYFLSLYLETGNRAHLDSFRRTIAVPLAYRRGRDALESKPPKLEVARRAFLDGGIATADITAGIWMLRNFRGFHDLEEALARWRETDQLILELETLGNTAGAKQPLFSTLELLKRVERIDTEITPRTIVFSQALDNSARTAELVLLTANFALASLLAALTIWRVGRVLKQRRQSEDALAWQASHDDLTGLVNRRAFEHRLALMTKLNKDRGYEDCALLYLDLDQFKIVNDTSGHAAGDALLRQLCSPLSRILRSQDLFARLGGDEFSVLMPGIDMAGALAIAERLRSAVENLEFIWNGQTFGVTASIGLAHNNGSVVAPKEMMTRADMACFMAKEKGRNRVHAHRNEDQDLLDRVREMNWVQRIQKALSENRFCLYGQEIVSLQQSEDQGVHLEILVRMRDEAGVLVPPSSFIPAAERFGLMKLIDRWVVTRTFQTLVERRMLGEKAPVTCCAINLSGGTFGDAAFLDFLKRAFAEFKVSPQIICFEVTETTAIVNPHAARAFVGDLRKLGCTFALDDFGSGMSSFNYLKELPVDYLKIDGAFVRNLLTDRPDRAMVEMISHVGHIMGKRIVAEFVETEAIAEALREIGVDYGQGFGLAAPELFNAHFEGRRIAAKRPQGRYERLSA